MTDDVERAIERFLDSADEALSEYERGYADPDATVRLLESHIDDLRDAVSGE